MSLFIHAANLAILASFLVRDILWLRALSVLAGALFIAYFGLRPAPELEPIAWNGVFMLLNVVQIARLLRERRPVHLGEREQRLYDLAFRALSPRELLRLIAIGRWEEAKVGAVLIEQGSSPDRVLALCDGKFAVEVDGRRVAELAPGRLVGEMSYLTGAPTTARVRCVEPALFLALPANELRALTRESPELRAALQRVIGLDLAAKLRPSATP